MGSFAPLENALTLSFSPIRFPDGSPMTLDDFAGAQALLSRTSAPGAGPDVWDPAARSWLSASSVDLGSALGVPLLPPKAAADPWRGIFVGAGQRDVLGTPLLQAAKGNFPQYRWRGVFRARRGKLEAFGIGPESAPIEFASATAAARLGAELTPSATNATRLRFLLRNAVAQPAGFLEIDASGGDTVLTLANFDASGAALAAVTLLADGSIRLAPAGKQKLIVAGDLEVERVRYLPSSGLPKKDLP